MINTLPKDPTNNVAGQGCVWTRRRKGDRHQSNHVDWKKAVLALICGERPGEVVGYSWYEWGASIVVSSIHNQLEIQTTRGGVDGRYAACCTFVWGDTMAGDPREHINELQIRSTDDCDCITLTFPRKGRPTVSTQQANTPLEICPKGELHLSSLQGVFVNGKRIEDLIENICQTSMDLRGLPR